MGQTTAESKLESRWPQVAGRGAAVACGVLGALVLVGWHTHCLPLLTVHAHWVAMVYNTALSFLVSGIGLWLALSGRRAALFCGLFVLAVGTLTLCEYVCGVDLGLDQLLMAAYAKTSSRYPGRMSLQSALCFMSSGGVILLLGPWRRRGREPAPAVLLGALMVALGTLSLCGYLVGLATTYSWGVFKPQAAHTALGFIVLGLGAAAAAAGLSRESARRPWLLASTVVGCLTFSLCLWQAVVADQVAHERSDYLPALVLHVTLATALLAASSVDLVLRLRRQATALGTANDALQHEVDQHQLAQELLRLDEARLEALLRFSQMTHATLPEITDYALEQAVLLTRSRIGYLAFMNDDESVLTMHSWSKTAMAECAIIDKPIVYPVVSTGLWGEAVRQRRPVITNDYAAPNPLKRGHPEGHVRVRRHMNIPVFDGERIVAVAGVGNKEEPYDDADVRQLTLLMEGMWRVLQRKQAEEALAAAHDELEARVEQRTLELSLANDQLRDAELRYRTLFEQSPDGILLLDPATLRAVAFNDTACRQLGYSREEFAERAVRDYEVLQDEGTIRQRAESIVATGRDDFQTRHCTKSGEERHVHVSVQALELDGRMLLFTIFRDITARVVAEEQVRRSEQRYRSLVEATAAVVWNADAEGRFVAPQATWSAYTGQEPAAALGHGWLDMLRDDDRAALADMWAVAQAQPAAFAIECEVWCASAGRHRWCVARAVPILDPDGSVREWIGALNDVDDRQRAERELAQTNAELARSNADLGRSNTELARSNADLEQFAYVASHDLQEPLRMVASYLQLLQRRYQGHLDADADEFIHFAVDGATRMKGLINALLEYSRVRTRGRPLELVDADLALDQALHDLSLAVEDSGALVSREPLPTVLADGRQLGQVFLNLIGNALKFHGDAPPRVHVCAERADGQWRFAVRDNGIGLDPEFGERIFGIFERLNAGATYPGTGIGLAVCKSILERHGGRIWVESQPGAGATFFFTLPAVGEVS